MSHLFLSRTEERRRSDILDRESAAPGHGLRLFELLERRDGGMHHVDGVRGTQGLGEHIVHAGALEDRREPNRQR